MDNQKEFKVWLAEDGLESSREILAADHEAAAEAWAREYDAGDYPLSRNEGRSVRIIVDGDDKSLVFNVRAEISTSYIAEEIT